MDGWIFNVDRHSWLPTCSIFDAQWLSVFKKKTHCGRLSWMGIHQKQTEEKQGFPSSNIPLICSLFYTFMRSSVPLPNSEMVVFLFSCFIIFSYLFILFARFLFCFLLTIRPLMSGHVHIIPTDIRI
jgi:hypothetical protein